MVIAINNPWPPPEGHSHGAMADMLELRLPRFEPFRMTCEGHSSPDRSWRLGDTARKGHRNKADKQLINVCYMIIIWCVVWLVCYKYSESRAHQQEVPWLQHQSTYEPCLTVLKSVAPLAFVLWMNQKGLGPWNALVGTHGVPGTKMVPLEDIGSCKPPKISWVPSGNQRWWRIRHL